MMLVDEGMEWNEKLVAFSCLVTTQHTTTPFIHTHALKQVTSNDRQYQPQPQAIAHGYD
jgi:hypothetical protein